MDENVIPTENLPSQNAHVKAGPQATDNTKRSPFKELGNNVLGTRASGPTPKSIATPSKYKVISELDEERTWRERTEVVTAIDHSAYKDYAKEMITAVIDQIPSATHRSTVVDNKLLHPTVAEFRGSPVAALVGDSDSEYESAGELDDTAIAQIIPSPVVPKANSTLLEVSNSANNTLNRSDVGTLLNSFENMKLNETKDIPEEDNFHDASDTVENTSLNLSPENKDAEKISTSLQPNMHNDTFDQLTASFEKVAVSDTSDMNTPVKSKEKPLAHVDPNKPGEIEDSPSCVVEPKVAIILSETSSPKPEKMPNDDSQLHLKESGKEGQTEASLEEVAGNLGTGFVKADEEDDVIVPKKGYNLEFLDNMDDPSFDPFSTKAAVTNSPDKEKSEVVANSVTKERQSDCLDKSGGIIDISEKTALLEVQEANEVNYKETGQTEATEAVVVPEDRQANSKNVFAEKVQQSSPPTEQDPHDEKAVSPQKRYNLDFDKLEDPNFDPFATKSAVSNSPEKVTKEIVAEAQADELVEIVKPVSVTQAQILSENDYDKQEGSHAQVDEDPVEDGSLKTEMVTESTSEEQEEEIIPPKKGYNMDLENVEDPNFNPFTTKTSVSNSPERKKVPISQVESESKQKEEDSVKILETEEEVKISEDVALITDGTVVESAKEEMTTEQRKADVAMDVSEEDEPIPPKKEYNLDFLDNLDDPSLNPFATKTTVTNSPDKKDVPSANSKMVEEASEAKEVVVDDVIEKEKTKQNKTSENIVVEDIPTSCAKDGDIASSEMVMSEKQKEPSETQEEDEPVPPKKGYNLDFLDNLDDPNFNPFTLKTTVTNSPDKKNGQVAESKTPEVPKPKEKVEKKKPVVAVKETEKVTQKASSVKEKETVEMKTVMPTESETEEKLEAQEEDEIIPPKKGYDLDFLDNLDDPNFNPFSTKTTVNNSPEKKNGPVGENKVSAEDALKPKKVAEKKPVAGVKEEDKATQVKKTSENASCAKGKDAPRSKTVVAKEAQNKGTSEVQDDEVIPPKKGYNLDLDNLDDPNFNPFATKMSVSNSPDRKKEPVVESKKAEENKVSEEVPKPEEEKKQVKEAGKPVGMKKKKPVAKAPEGKQDDFATEPKGGYKLDLDHFDDPNFNPFATKSAVSNSPDKTNMSVGEKMEESLGASEEKKTQAKDAKSVNEIIKKMPKADNAEEMEEDIVPKKGYQLDFLDNLGDPDFNPFATKTTVSNSPNKRKATQENMQVKEKLPDSKDENIVETQTTGSQITKSEFASSLGSIDFDQISKEAIQLASEVTPKPQTPEKISESVQPRDVFSPLPAKHSSTKQDTFGGFGVDEFTSATEFFNNPEDLDVLGSHGTEGDKINLVRNSLYVKFDPLVSGRQSLAPYLAQQLLSTKEEEDARRCSGLISFSPSPIKPQRSKDGNGTPVRAQTITRADETLILESTTLDSTVVGETTNISIMSGGTAFNNTVISNAPSECANETVLQLHAAPTEKMVPERVMNERLKNLELSMQDTLLRKIRAFEEEQKKSKQQIEEQNIALSSMEEENGTLKATIVKMQEVLSRIMKQEESKEKERKNQLVLLENQYETKISALQKESQQYLDELKNAEAPFFDLVKKFERLREVTECLRRNEESLKSENEGLKAKLAQKEESFKTVLQTLEENYAKAQEEFSREKEKHEKELGKASVTLKRAEVKILSLNADNERLAALLDDITNKFG